MDNLILKKNHVHTRWVFRDEDDNRYVLTTTTTPPTEGDHPRGWREARESTRRKFSLGNVDLRLYDNIPGYNVDCPCGQSLVREQFLNEACSCGAVYSEELYPYVSRSDIVYPEMHKIKEKLENDEGFWNRVLAHNHYEIEEGESLEVRPSFFVKTDGSWEFRLTFLMSCEDGEEYEFIGDLPEGFYPVL